jgi:hypothetical protein
VSNAVYALRRGTNTGLSLRDFIAQVQHTAPIWEVAGQIRLEDVFKILAQEERVQIIEPKAAPAPVKRHVRTVAKKAAKHSAKVTRRATPTAARRERLHEIMGRMNKWMQNAELLKAVEGEPLFKGYNASRLLQDVTALVAGGSVKKTGKTSTRRYRAK